MTRQEIAEAYRAYIDCLNRQDWNKLGQFVHDEAVHNGRLIGLPGYRAMLENDYDTIPDLHFTIDLLICEPPYVSCRLLFDCHPKASFMGLPINGGRAVFSENVIYEFLAGKIKNVHSLIDKASLEAQFSKP